MNRGRLYIIITKAKSKNYILEDDTYNILYGEELNLVPIGSFPYLVYFHLFHAGTP